MNPATDTTHPRASAGLREKARGGRPAPESFVQSSAYSSQVVDWTVSATKVMDYRVRWVPNLLTPDGMMELADLFPHPGRVANAVVVCDRTVHALYEPAMRAALEDLPVRPKFVVVEPGENAKSLQNVEVLCRAFDEAGLDRRRDIVIGFGGGVVTDLTCFASSIYRRGVVSVRIPTTLLGLIDAGVGVKTGVNLGASKNRLGTYAPPALSLLSPAFLTTLPERHFRNGVGEIIKIALSSNADLWHLLESGMAGDASSFGSIRARDEICQMAVSTMLAELEPNLWEQELRRAVDLGHSFSPIVELADLGFLHGEAVAWEVLLTCFVSHRRGLLSAPDLDRVLAVCTRFGLTNNSLTSSDVLAVGLRDVLRHRAGSQHFPVPDRIGRVVFLEDTTVAEWGAALRDMNSAIARVGGPKS